MLKLIRETNGTMTLDDLQSYKITTGQALTSAYRGYRLFTTSAPSSGAVLLNILKIMEQYDPADSADVNLTTHRLDEAMRFAYGARLELGDPLFVDGDVAALERAMLSADKARQTAGRILDDATQPVEAYDPPQVYSDAGHGTSHIVAADGTGMVVGSTTTVNLLFGSQLMTPDTGIILNDEMNDFSIPGVTNEFGFGPAPANFVRARKRPLSSITPVVVEFPNGTLCLTAGAAGGSRIISATAQVVWRALEYDMGMRDALAVPRLHDQLMPNTASLEHGFDGAIAASLAAKGHNVTWVRPGSSAVQAIRRLGDGSFEPASEPRQKGSAGLTV